MANLAPGYILEIALATNYIHESELTALQEWRKAPETWLPK